MRSFISIDIESKDVLDKISNFQNDLKGSACPMKIVHRDNLHLTLKFLGDISDASYKRIVELLEPSISQFPAFQADFKGTGFFPTISELRVVWIGMDAPEIVYIQRDIDETLTSIGFREDRKFVPHLTVSRIKSSLNKKSLLNVLDRYKEHEFGTQKIEKIKLKKSTLTPQGPIYETLKEFDLKKV